MAATRRILVDPIRCDGRGLCAELLPDRITLGRLGLPHHRPEAPRPDQRAALREASRAALPALALRIERSR